MIKKENLLSNGVASAIQLAVAIIIVPIYIKIFGYKTFGTISFFWVIIGGFSVLDLGLAKKATISIAGALPTERQKISRYYALSALSVGLILTTIGVVILGVAIIVDGINIPGLYIQQLYSSLILLLLLCLQLYIQTLFAQLDGLMKFNESNKIQILSYILLHCFSIAAGLILIPSIESVLSAALIAKLTTAIILHRQLKIQICIKEIYNFRKIIKDLISEIKTTRWIAGNNILGYILENLEKYIVVMFHGTSGMASYLIPYSLLTKARMLPEVLSRTYFPSLSVCSLVDGQRIVKKISILIIRSLTFCLGAFMMVADETYKIWLGQGVDANIVNYSFIISLGLLSGSAAYPAYTYMEASKRSNILFKVLRITSPVYVIILILVTLNYGLLGAASCWAIRLLIDSSLLQYLALELNNFTKVMINLISGMLLLGGIYILKQNLDLNIEIKLVIMAALFLLFTIELHKTVMLKSDV